MTGTDLLALAPLLVLGAGAIVLMLQIAFHRNVRVASLLALGIFIAAAVAVIPALEVSPRPVTPLLQADPMALLFSAVFCLAGAATTVLSVGYMTRRDEQPEEYFLLLLLSTLGACVLAYSAHLASLLLGMELLTVALYALIAYPDKSVLPLEAASKYLVLSAAATATTLFGFALLYTLTGTLEFAAMGPQLAQLPADVPYGNQLLPVAALLVLAGMGFKLSLAPFHMWTPDVYQGAPSPVTGFLASVSKAAIFLAVLRWFLQADLFLYQGLLQCAAIIALLSMLGGNLLALRQSNIKRMLAYSSIAHMGYLLIILVASANIDHRALATEAALYYLIAYIVTTLAAFGTLTIMGGQQGEQEMVELQDVSGLFWRQPLLACLMLVALLSLAGIPLTAGFIAKFYIVTAAVSGYHWGLLGALVIGSGIGIYYYLRVVFYMSRRDDISQTQMKAAGGWPVHILACVLLAIIVLLGTVPQPLMAYLRLIT
ncbi:MAG: NADH-quinone oxidoreductase subunit N [Gammaproteobacteria bacterium]|nr:NADH-quinone oxidoreductase subunit N [Gammaproteobacteria bacterium]